MKTMKSNKTAGISLVALVVTIIVLIILTAAVIVTFMEGGIIDRAKEATFKSDIRTYQEQLSLIRAEDQIAISTNEENYETKVMDKTITGEAIKEVLPEFKVEEYGDLVQVVDGKIVAIEELSEEVLKEKWLIDLGIGEDEEVDVVYSVGDEVTIGEEKFRVLKDNGSTLTLLTAKNITTDTYVQSTSAPTVEFSSTNYWSSETSYPYNLNDNYVSSIQATDAIGIAKAYANKIAEDTGVTVTGRLMTAEEVVELDGDMYMAITEGCPTWINQDDEGNNLKYWLGSAGNDTSVWLVSGGGEYFGCYGYASDCGVRPVITISESAVN